MKESRGTECKCSVRKEKIMIHITNNEIHRSDLLDVSDSEIVTQIAI